MSKRAKTLDDQQVQRVINVAHSISAIPESAELRVLLSFFAGLRAAEIANLPVEAMLDSAGYPASTIEIYKSVGKRRKPRSVPMHPRIAASLELFRLHYPNAHYVAISRRSDRKAPYRLSPNAVTVWFHRLYRIAGMNGCSSHSGRRTFATNLARTCGVHNNSLLDVQHLLGHEQLTTTQAYVEASANIVDLVRSLGMPAPDPFLSSHRSRPPRLGRMAKEARA